MELNYFATTKQDTNVPCLEDTVSTRLEKKEYAPLPKHNHLNAQINV